MSEKFKELNDTNFKESIASGVTLVDFYADWCGPCKMITPILEELAGDLEGKASIAKVDVDSSQETATHYGVTSIPTLILIKDGSEVDRVVGVRDKDALLSMVNKAL